jgi:hypothetical protein
MKRHRFTVVLAGVSELTPDLANALFEATGGDVELEMCEGVATLDFDRPAATLRKAITSAIEQVEGAGMGLRVVRVESDVANTIAKINAELLGTPGKGESVARKVGLS